MFRDKNKILFLHGSNDLYGSSRVLIEVINLLYDNGYEIFLILPCSGPLDNILKTKTSIYYHNLGVFRKKYFNLFGILNRFKKVLIAIKFVSKIIRINNINTVYTNTSVIIAGGISAKLNSIRSCFHIHEIPTNRFYLSIMKKIINFFSDEIVLVSKSVNNYWNFSTKSKINIVYNGFDFKPKSKVLKKTKSTIVFTSVGRLIPYKGHLYLLEVAKELIKYNSKFKFYIIGDTFSGYENYESSIKKFVNQNGLINNVFFIGFTNNVNSYLNKTDFFIHTSIDPDPLPTVIIEAISLDVPVIATNLGGSVEILDSGLGGLLIPKNKPKKSAKLIVDFLKNKKDILKRKKYAHDYLKKFFSKKEFNDKILSLFIN